MSNQLNKNKSKLKEKDEIHTAKGNLILAQQAEHRRRFQKIADGNRSAEALLEETRQRVELVKETREEFLNWCLPREENPDGRGSTRTAQSAEGARVWSELFVRDTLPKGIDSLNGDPSPNSIAAEIPNVSDEIPSVSVGIPSVSMAGPKEKLPKFDGDEAVDPIRHCKTCKTIWRANGVTDTNEWMRQFSATLRGVAIDWFTSTDPKS